MARRPIACVSAALALIPAATWAQTTVWRPDPGKPVMVTADDISIDNAERVATFTGNARLTQGGEVRLQCWQMRVYYLLAGAPPAQDQIDRIECEQ